MFYVQVCMLIRLFIRKSILRLIYKSTTLVVFIDVIIIPRYYDVRIDIIIPWYYDVRIDIIIPRYYDVRIDSGNANI